MKQSTPLQPSFSSPRNAMPKQVTSNKTANNAKVSKVNSGIRPPLHPFWVLLIAIVLPGVGQVVNNTPMRGLVMVSFMIMLGLLTFNLANPAVSMVGKLAGGIFITLYG